MTKKELVNKISRDTGLSDEDVYAVVQRALDLISEAIVKGETVQFRNFGIFKVRWHKPKQGRNPHRPEQVVPIPARPTIKFKPGKKLQELLYEQFLVKDASNKAELELQKQLNNTDEHIDLNTNGKI